MGMTNVLTSSDSRFVYRESSSANHIYWGASAALETFDNAPNTHFGRPSPADEEMQDSPSRGRNKTGGKDKGGTR